MMISFIYKLFLIHDDARRTLLILQRLLKKLKSPHINNGFSLLLYRGVKLNKSSLKATPSTK